MAFDYGKHFGELRVLHDLMSTPDERRWRLAALERDPEPHAIVLYLGCNAADLRPPHGGAVQALPAGRGGHVCPSCIYFHDEEYVDIEPTAAFGRSCGPAGHEALGLEGWNALVRGELARAAAGGATTMATIYHGCQRMTCHFEEEQPRVLAEMTPGQQANGVDPTRAREVVARLFPA
jgi:hypothetical protein